ncbi:hypothetical protein PRIPAC_75599 [Pristionchus pacificus]|uniref:Uncharacterized protein n=1 Tax=Pristionchus pacificus TaxID=54126 RepID=A0A2A6CRS6_PRIPA|nr:hypothetical protein PRIPAC_75599 [Pristionchus pacificus]|eukprot:PDM80731.1 hypothetical protein PRIPAC_35734 [Pristionchus pacificus]
MALLKARLNRPKARPSTASAAAAVAAPTNVAAPTLATAVMPVSDPIAVIGSPALAQNSSLKQHNPQASPSVLTHCQPNKQRTPGISSLIASSILSPDFLLGVLPKSEQTKSTHIYKSDQLSGPGFLNSSTEDVFAFGDVDPEETGEKLKLNEDSDWEPDAHDTSNGDKELQNNGLEQAKRNRFGQKQSELEKRATNNKEFKKAVASMYEKEKVRQETLEFSEQLMQRRNENLSSDFAVVTQCEDTQCAIDAVKKNAEDADKPPLPRLIIRMPKNTSVDFRRRSRKKQHCSDKDTTDEDDDWYGEKPKKRRGRKPKTESHPENTYSSRLVDPFTLEQKKKEDQMDAHTMSMKDRILKKWKKETAGTDAPLPDIARGVEGRAELRPMWKIVGDYKPADVRDRLIKMKPCEGEVVRDTFLVLKSELHSSDCALWRVDSMSLLQKFTSFLGKTEDGEFILLYKKSTTYSGWCEQLQSNYMVVEVRPVRSRNIKNRGEGIIEPHIPLVDLLPAIPEEAKDRYCARSSKSKELDDQLGAQQFICEDGVRNGLSKLIKNMMSHVHTFDYFSNPQTGKDISNDSDKIESFLKELQHIISDRVSFPRDFQQNLKMYLSCRVIDCENKENTCQICGEAPVTNTLQLFNLHHDTDVSGDEGNTNCNSEDGLPAMDYYTCDECCKFSQRQHRLVHFRKDLADRIEDRLLGATYEMPSRSPEQIIEALRQNHSWLKEMILTQTDIWDAIVQLEEAEDIEESAAEFQAAPETSAVSATEAIQIVVPIVPVPLAQQLPAVSSGFSIASLLHS